MAVKNPFRGLGVALVTPFSQDGSIDFTALGKVIDHQIEGGVDFLCVLGTTAETACLSIIEREAVKNFAIARIAKRVPILLGCGGNNTSEVVRQLREDDFTGIDGILSVCPYYNKPSQEGIYQHFKAIAQATSLPVVLYNVPGRTSVNMSANTTLRLAHDFENVVAIKEASGDIQQVLDIMVDKPEDFDVLSGDDGISFELIVMGAQGVVSVLGNALPKELGAMVHLSLAGNINAALPLHRAMSHMCKLMFVEGNPAGVKTLMAQLGLLDNVLRLPLLPATEATSKAIEKALATLHQTFNTSMVKHQAKLCE